MSLDSKVISEVKRTATEDLDCDACKWLTAGFTATISSKLTKGEKKSIQSAQRNGFKILKGGQYFEYIVEYQGKVFTSNCLIKIHDICIKYNMYNKEVAIRNKVSSN